MEPMRMEPKKTLVFGAADTSKTWQFSEMGEIHTIIMKLPNWTNGVTATIAATNDGADEVWADKTPRVKNDTYVFHQLRDRFPINCNVTLTVTLSGVPGGSGGSVELSVYVI